MRQNHKTRLNSAASALAEVRAATETDRVALANRRANDSEAERYIASIEDSIAKMASGASQTPSTAPTPATPTPSTQTPAPAATPDHVESSDHVGEV